MPIEASRWLSPVLLALPLGLLATLAAVLGAAVSPLLPVVASGAAVILAIGYARPLWTIYLAVLALPLEFQVQDLAFFNLTPSKGVFLLGAAGWAAAQIVHRRPLVVNTSLTLPLMAVILVMLPGFLVAEDQLVVLNQLGIWVASFCLFQAVAQSGDEQFVRRLFACLAVAGIGLAILAITDETFQGPSTRADGGIGSPNALATLLLASIFPAVSRVFSERTWKRWAFAAAAAISVYGLLLTESRGGFLALVVGLAVAITWRPMRRVAIAGVAAVAVLAFAGANPLGAFLDETAIGERIASITTDGASDPRLPVYRKTVEMIEDHPIFGVGTNNYGSVSADYGLGTSGTVGHAHNALLTITAERGAIGLVTFLIFAFALARILGRGLAETTGERRALLTGVMAVFVACAAHNLVDYTIGSVLLTELFVLAACGVVLTRRSGRGSTLAEPVTAP